MDGRSQMCFLSLEKAPFTIMIFFQKKDIEEFIKWGGKEYDVSDLKHRKFVTEHMKPLFQQTKYWANEVAGQLPGFIVTTGRYLKRGRKTGTNQTIPVFQTYTWAMLVPKEYKDLGIYFTVGVDISSEHATGSLIYKLDCEKISASFSRKRKLTLDEKAKCQAYLNEHSELWQEIDMNDIEGKNWKTLIEDTVEFVEKHMTDYMNLLHFVNV